MEDEVDDPPAGPSQPNTSAGKVTVCTNLLPPPPVQELPAQESDGENPWPYVQTFFKFLSRQESQVSFHCVTCKPKVTVIKAHVTTLQNLRSHMKTRHFAQFPQFEELSRMGKKAAQNLKKHREKIQLWLFLFVYIESLRPLISC